MNCERRRALGGTWPNEVSPWFVSTGTRRRAAGVSVVGAGTHSISLRSRCVACSAELPPILIVPVRCWMPPIAPRVVMMPRVERRLRSPAERRPFRRLSSGSNPRLRFATAAAVYRPHRHLIIGWCPLPSRLADVSGGFEGERLQALALCDSEAIVDVPKRPAPSDFNTRFIENCCEGGRHARDDSTAAHIATGARRTIASRTELRFTTTTPLRWLYSSPSAATDKR